MALMAKTKTSLDEVIEIEEARMRQGLSKGKLATLAGISNQTYSHILKCGREDKPLPEPSTGQVRTALGLPTD